MIGTTLSHFRVTAKLGAGGMGEVYRAEDTKLGREVAIKVLPEAVASDAERLARFKREAKVLASLNHPNIVTIHEIEEHEGKAFIAMELVEGTTLADEIPMGGLTLERFFEFAVPLADAIAAAHEQGITHRDLKPSNVMIDGKRRIKILDFGLARTAPGTTEGEATEVLESDLTAAGTLLGTFPYMSPEQIRGEAVDARSDIFSLGIILHQMATGDRPFSGNSSPELLAAILKDQPGDPSEIKPELPRQLGRIVRSCLEKEPDSRFQSALDVRNQLEALREELREGSSVGAAAQTTPRSNRTRLVLVSFLGALLLAVGGLWLAKDREGDAQPEASQRQTLSRVAGLKLSPLTSSAELELWPSWSPDGTQLLFCREVGGFSKIFVKDLTSGEERQLTQGDQDDIQPAWSPNSRVIAFVRATGPDGKLQPSEVQSGLYDEGDVWLLDLDSAEERRIIEEGFHPAFSPDGELIAVDAEWAGPHRIWTTDSRGRNPKQITTDTSEAVIHTHPSWSPDGSRLVFQNAEKNRYDIRTVEFSTGATTSVTDDPYTDLVPTWSAQGNFIYLSSYRSGGLNIWRIPVSSAGQPQGVPEQVTFGAGQDFQPSIAPDGTRLTFAVLQQNADLWRLPVDPTSGAATGDIEAMIVSTREDSRGGWSPDGTLLAYNSDRDGPMNIWLRSLPDGSDRPVTQGEGGDYQPDWSPDGQRIAFFSSRSGNADIWLVDVESGELRQITDHPALDTNPFFSPDGTKIAFQSDRDGRKEVWLMEADGSDARQLTTVGANDHFMRWSVDGDFIYFRSPSLNGVCRVPVSGGEAEPIGMPVGWHMSFSPDRSLLLDGMGHRVLWVFPMDGSEEWKVFESNDPDVRIDYPEWSPDGRWVIFDRVEPQGADLWLLEGLL